LLEFINKYGMTNGIDTMQQKAADELEIYYTDTHLIRSECFTGQNHPDSDIQYSYDSLTLSLEIRIKNEFSKYNNHLIHIGDFETAKKYVKQIPEYGRDYAFLYRDDVASNIIFLRENITYPFYLISDSVIVFSYSKHSGKYYDRLKKDLEFNISDALAV